jgi:uncharacterized protein (DUF305 family)
MRLQTITSVLAAAVAAGGLVAGCGTTSNPGPTTTPPPAPSTTHTRQQHNQADVAFLQSMIPHHAEAIAMAQLAPSRVASPQVKALASRIQAEEDPEIQQMMSALLRSWGAPVPATTEGTPGMQHEHAQIPGMMSTAQMQQLTASSGPAFDRMFLQRMIAHHQGAVSMSQTELAQGINPAARKLAQRIITAQQAEIQQMEKLLRQI